MPLVGAEHGDVPLLLPLASTESHLRRALLPGLTKRLESNFSRGARDVRLFEIGTAFAEAADGGVPVETTRLAVLFTGARDPHHWTGESSPCDIWDLRGLLEELAAVLGGQVEPGEAQDAAGLIGMEPGTILRVRSGDARTTGSGDAGTAGFGDARTAGVGGRISERAIDAPAWAAPVWAAEAILTAEMVGPQEIRVRPLPAHPGVERDIALLVPASVTAGDIDATIRAAAGDLLESLAPFDVYEGPGLAQGQRSVAFRLRFRASDRTLTMEEVDARMTRILERLGSEHDVEQRA
jgi:phenylalanyl-tRNA synthetase beta chain